MVECICVSGGARSTARRRNMARNGNTASNTCRKQSLTFRGGLQRLFRVAQAPLQPLADRERRRVESGHVAAEVDPHVFVERLPRLHHDRLWHGALQDRARVLRHALAARVPELKWERMMGLVNDVTTYAQHTDHT